MPNLPGMPTTYATSRGPSENPATGSLWAGCGWFTQLRQLTWLWVKTNGTTFGGRCTTHFRLFLLGVGCSLGVRDFDP